MIKFGYKLIPTDKHSSLLLKTESNNEAQFERKKL